jgi:hypothetical protein
MPAWFVAWLAQAASAKPAASATASLALRNIPVILVIPVTPSLSRARTFSRSSRASLSEGSVNLDGALPRLGKTSQTAETFGNG